MTASGRRASVTGVPAVVALVCSFLPAVHLEISGFLGAGDTERAYRVQRDVAFVPELLSHSLVVVLPPLVLLGTAVAACVYGSRRWVTATAFVAGLTFAVACYRVETHFTFIEHGAMVGCDTPCAGFILLPAVRDLRDDLRSTPAGQQPGFELTGGENGYYAKPLDAWWGLLASGLMLGLLGGYGVARLAMSTWRAVAFVAAAAFVVVLWLFLQALGRME